MEPFPSAIPTLSDPADVARFFEERAGDIGILATPEARGPLFDSLPELLAKIKRHVVRISPPDELQKALGEWMPLTPEPVRRSPIEWRDALVVGLRKEQQAAQERTTAAKAANVPVDSFDRDVSSWLAAGLRDLFDDKVTGESFLAEGKGIFARLAARMPEARFTESDFLRPDGIRFLEASRSAQSMLTKLSLASTNQYRIAAARLLNRVLEHVDAPQAEVPFLQGVAQALKDRGEELILLVEADGPLDWLRDVDAPIRAIVAAAEANALPAQAALLRYGLPEPEAIHEAEAASPAEPVEESPPAEPAPTPQMGGVEDEAPANPASALQEELARAELLIRRGLLRQEEVPEDVDALRQRLAHAWRAWFTQQLESLDAEDFLMRADEDSALARHIAALTRIWEKSAVALRLPASEKDFDDADQAIEEIHRLHRERRTNHRTLIEAGMAFDAAVAAGGAPLDLFTDEVRWWLLQENRDCRNYRIVLVDESEFKPARPISDPRE